MAASPASDTDISQEDRLRANMYALLGRFLTGPPDDGLLRSARSLESDDTDMGNALGALRDAARTDVETVSDEFMALFVGMPQGELIPYGSYYMTGFLHEKPLAKLRGAMRELGIARAEGVSESEDHIGALCEMMAGLITGAFGAPAELPVQRTFFDDHLAPWAGRFFEDLESAESAVFYKPVGTIGNLFARIETQAFGMEG